MANSLPKAMQWHTSAFIGFDCYFLIQTLVFWLVLIVVSYNTLRLVKKSLIFETMTRNCKTKVELSFLFRVNSFKTGWLSD